jgi:hypothetical protein
LIQGLRDRRANAPKSAITVATTIENTDTMTVRPAPPRM